MCKFPFAKTNLAFVCSMRNYFFSRKDLADLADLELKLVLLIFVSRIELSKLVLNLLKRTY